jgi:predicted glycosyltransferase involved in capsule biosynthesis
MLKWHCEHFPDIPIYLGDKPVEKFNVSGSRNIGCIAAIEDGCDVLIVSDADVLVKPDNLRDAIEKAYKENLAVLPYDCYVVPDASTSELIVNDLTSVSEIMQNPGYHPQNWNHCSGIVVLSATTFKTLNGWDERFEAWGYEDDAFREAHFRILGQRLVRVKGNLVGLIHDDRDDSAVNFNRDMFNKHYIDKDKAYILEYIKGNMLD